MDGTVGVRELRQNLSRYLDRVKDGEALTVTERGREVARLIPSGPRRDTVSLLVERLGASPPRGDLVETLRREPPRPAPGGIGISDALAEQRAERL